MDDKIKRLELLGCKVRDLVTGFEGIAESKHIYLNGCVRYRIQPPINKVDNKLPEGVTADIEQLEFIDNGVSERISFKPTGDGERFIPDR